jgi:hypothetical protein
LLGELDKLEQLLGSEQPAAALDLADNMNKKHPDRACVLYYKAMLEGELKGPEAAKGTVARYIEVYPDNPVALVEKAVLQAESEGGKAAALTLQRALEVTASEIPQQIYGALGVVAQALLAQGHILAARGYLLMQIAFSEARDPGPMNLLARINTNAGIHLLLKQDHNLEDCPANVTWKADFQAALEAAHKGQWRVAAEKFAALAPKAGNAPVVLRNLATLRGWNADELGASEALKAYAASPDVPLDDAVEAEAVAQLIDEDNIDQVDVLTLRYPIRDFDQLQAKFFVHPLTPRLPFDLSRLATEDQPAPKSGFFLLDRPTPASGANITPEDAPRIVGQALVYGRETDRDARLEVVTYRTEELDAARKTLATVAADAIDPNPTEEVADQIPAVQHLLSWNWRLPEDTKPEQRLQLMAAERRRVLLERWTNMPLKFLGGKTPAAAASEPRYRVPLLAAILILELTRDNAVGEFDYNELRAKLGLPVNGPIDPTHLPENEIPLDRFARLDLAKLDDAKLLRAFDQAAHFGHFLAARRFANEIIARPSVKGDLKASAYGLLAQTEPDTTRALGYIQEARKQADAAGQSSAVWDLSELNLLLGQGQIAAAERVLNHIRAEHIREQGVAQALFQVLVDYGVVNPDGTPTAAAANLVAAGAGPGSASAPATASAGKIWTPGSEAAPSGKKSAIWTPGD